MRSQSRSLCRLEDLLVLIEAQPFQGKKKGADGGIDGLKFFRDLDKKEVRKIIVSVKGGENVGPAMVKDLFENSPALQRWVNRPKQAKRVPSGTKESCPP